MDIENLLVLLRNQNYLDILLYFALLFGIIKGWKTGSFINFFYLTTLISGIGLGFRYSDYVGNFVQGWLNSEKQVSEIIAGVVIFLGVLTLSSIIISILPNKIKTNPVDLGSRFFGSIFSFALSNLLLCIIFTLVSLFSLSPSLQKFYQESKLVTFYVSAISFPQEVLSRITGTDILMSINKITELTGSSSYVDGCLEIERATEADIELRPDLALELISTINNYRGDLSLDYLESRQNLSDVAEKYAHKMYTQGFFCHQDPLDSSEAKERLEKNNINFNSIGENLALAASIDLAHESILQSPKHKDTVEGSSYRYIGIGVVEGPLGLIVVQLFTGG